MTREQLLHKLQASGTPTDVMQAMRAVPRERFVPANLAGRAWEDEALSLGLGSTISQPSMVAVVLQELQLSPGLSVLEVGSGSGYMLALLAAMGTQATGIEINDALAKSSVSALGGCARVLIGDASATDLGGPYDRVVFSAAITDLPVWALGPVAPSGFALAPVGRDIQELTRFYKTGDQARTGRLCRFVPFQ